MPTPPSTTFTLCTSLNFYPLLETVASTWSLTRLHNTPSCSHQEAIYILTPIASCSLVCLLLINPPWALTMSTLMETSLIHSDRLLSRKNFPLASIPEEEEERARAAHHMFLHGSTPACSALAPSEGRVQTRSMQNLSAQSSFTPEDSGITSQTVLCILGDKECMSCERSPTHKLVPCAHTLCFNHLLLGRDLDASKLSTCIRCKQVTSMHFLDASLCQHRLRDCSPSATSSNSLPRSTCGHHKTFSSAPHLLQTTTTTFGVLFQP